MADLGPAHVEAVARVLMTEFDDRAYDVWPDFRKEAEAVLSATDPAVHAALLAALVRAGVLERKWRNLRPCGCRAGSNALMCCDGEAPTTTQARYASKWEDACD